jgi:biotin-dependent carboxylase-like uncharacterized protein
MTASLHVVAPGLLSTIQDRGRVGYQHLGVPVSGALDPVSLQAANLLVGNPPDAGALEVACIGPTLVVEADSARIAVAGGANAAVDILPDAAATSGRRVALLQSLHLRRGEALRIGALTGATVLYVAVEGGFDIAPVLGSVATDIRGGIGGWQGRALAVGDRLPLRQPRAGERGEVCLEGLGMTPRPRIRVIKGPQDDHFPEREVAAFLEGEYAVGPSDRMAMRLTGRALQHSRGFDIASDAVAPGSVQVPGNGQPIVLLADRQTTGGYPKIATVISADLPALARLPVGAKVAFEAVTVAEAEAARRDHIAGLAAMQDRIVPLRRVGDDMAASLHACNLVSGVIDAAAA